MPGCDSLTRARLERYMSPQVGAREPCRNSFLGPWAASGLKEQTCNRFAARPAMGNKEADMLGAQGEPEIQRGIEFPRDASASQQGTEQDPFWAGSVQWRARLYSPH